jgi:hypothetical protein
VPKREAGSIPNPNMNIMGQELGSVSLSLCTTAHPLYTRFTNIFGASISEATMRPNPRQEQTEPLARLDEAELLGGFSRGRVYH